MKRKCIRAIHATLKYHGKQSQNMSVSGVGKSKRKKGGASAGARRGAMKDAIPDVRPPGQIKRAREDDEPAAENDEDDD